MKLDIRSQATGRLALEWPTLQRGADIYILTTECPAYTAGATFQPEVEEVGSRLSDVC
jgi:hypothetical protein